MGIRKRQRKDVVREGGSDDEHSDDESRGQNEKVMVQLLNENGEKTGAQMLLPVSATGRQLDELLATVLGDSEEVNPHAFFIDGEQVVGNVRDLLHKKQIDAFVEKQLREGRRVRPQDTQSVPFEAPEETVVEILYKPQAVFRVRPVTRCAASLDGHSEAVLVVSFSPDSEVLATGSGDKEVRIWDVHTLTPSHVLKGHSSWVQVLAWSPDGARLVSGSKDGVAIVWTHDGTYNNFSSIKYKAHASYLTHVSWEPLHRNVQCDRFVSASKDTTLKVWRPPTGLQLSLSGHQSCVTCVKWGGENRIYSASQDRTIIVWDAQNGAARCVLKGHAHWVNHLALSTDLVMRTGAIDHEERKFETREAAQEYSRQRYDTVISRSGNTERLVSCSDDNTMFLWTPQEVAAPVARLTGHQGAIFHIQFSPDGTMIASCSADKSVKLWNALDGKFITTFRGHVAPVYHVSWSLDSRMVVSGSRDSTLKLWSVKTRGLVEDMAGHRDEVFWTDWSPDGQRVATGSKDKTVRVWVH